MTRRYHGSPFADLPKNQPGHWARAFVVARVRRCARSVTPVDADAAYWTQLAESATKVPT